ncbi:hypothetical protein SAMN05421752_101414 [Natronorubrum thiooxidans]|uniref:Uncharacterized protein n=1 Tax=Natronorubrum thiooxidans TaxID=308853 RepID=A0A1N7CKL8_9EURY|nr:hypothetical protein SAMN05421752_101414 [Natronorubrum thiooxidans]
MGLQNISIFPLMYIKHRPLMILQKLNLDMKYMKMI